MRWVLAAWLSKYLLMRFCLIRCCRSPWTLSTCSSCQRIVLTTSPFTLSVAVHSNTDKHTFARPDFPCAWASVPRSSRYLLTRAKSKSTKSKEAELAAPGVGACTSLVLELHKLFQSWRARDWARSWSSCASVAVLMIALAILGGTIKCEVLYDPIKREIVVMTEVLVS